MTEANFKQIVVKRDGDRDIRFVGKLLGEVDSLDNLVHSNWGNFWTELKLYETKGGKFVCQRAVCISRSDRPDQYDAYVCANVDQVVYFFGQDALAKELYCKAEILAVVEVE